MKSPAVTIDNLGHAYIPGNWVFRNYSAKVDDGEIFSILGPNGRGKTTILKSLLHLIRPSEGCVNIEGRAAFVPQLFQLNFDYTVLDVVMMGRARSIGLFAQPSKKDRIAALDALERVGMADFAERSFQELSGGQRQIVVFARAIVAEAKVLILDEPTSALDLKNQGLILDWMLRLSHDDGLTIIFTTHHPQHALAVSDKTLLMFDENKYVCGPAKHVLSEENLHRLYGVEMKRIPFKHAGKTHETLVPIYEQKMS